jgi:hypothetical protein
MRVNESLAEEGSGQRERITVAGELLTCVLALKMVQRSSKLPSHRPFGPPNQLIVAVALFHAGWDISLMRSLQRFIRNGHGRV